MLSSLEVLYFGFLLKLPLQIDKASFLLGMAGKKEFRMAMDDSGTLIGVGKEKSYFHGQRDE